MKNIYHVMVHLSGCVLRIQTATLGYNYALSIFEQCVRLETSRLNNSHLKPVGYCFLVWYLLVHFRSLLIENLWQQQRPQQQLNESVFFKNQENRPIGKPVESVRKHNSMKANERKKCGNKAMSVGQYVVAIVYAQYRPTKRKKTNKK